MMTSGVVSVNELGDVRLSQSEFKTLQQGDSEKVLDTVLRASPELKLSQLLMEECVLHLAQAVFHPPTVLTYKSEHPYASYSEVRECVRLPGASKLLVSFDRRSEIGRGNNPHNPE